MGLLDPGTYPDRSGAEICSGIAVSHPKFVVSDLNLAQFWCHFGWIGVPGPACTFLLRVGVKMGPHFPAKSVNIVVLYSLFGLLGTLHRIWQDLPEMESGLAEQTLVSPRRGAG